MNDIKVHNANDCGDFTGFSKFDDCQNAQLLTSEPGKMSPLVPLK